MKKSELNWQIMETKEEGGMEDKLEICRNCDYCSTIGEYSHCSIEDEPTDLDSSCDDFEPVEDDEEEYEKV